MTPLQIVIQNWRALSPEEQLRRRWARIPRNAAISMAFEGEPVELAILQAAHARHPLPLDTLKPVKER